MGSEVARKGFMQDAGMIRIVFLKDHFCSSVEMGKATGRVPS